MEKKLIPILIILLAALLFTSSCTGVYTTSLPVAVSPSPVPDVSPAPTATTSPRVTPSPSPSPTPTPPPYEGELIAQYALQFDGYRYNYGGQDPSTGFDCSGLVYYVFKQFGYRLNRVAADQAMNGAEVREQKDLLPGDIICFSWITSSYINHVGIYIGEGKFIHAMDSANDVLITTLEEYLKTHRCYMRRIVGEEEKTTLAQIEQRERMDAEMLALQMAEEERQAAERARNASPSPTPPPAYIPDTAGGISKEEAEEQHRKEIEEAWRLIWEEEEASQGGQQPGTDEASGPAETPATGEPPAADPVTAEPVVPEPAQQESSIPDPAPADPPQNEASSREPESAPPYDPPPATGTDPVPDTSDSFPAEDLPTSDEFTIRISG